MDHLQLSTGDYAAIAAIVPRDSEGGVFWKEFLKTAYEDIVHLLQEKNIYHTMQRFKQNRPSSAAIIPYLNRSQLVRYAENLVRDAQFSVVGKKLVVRCVSRSGPEHLLTSCTSIGSWIVAKSDYWLISFT
jgi:hypothetical protein